MIEPTRAQAHALRMFKDEWSPAPNGPGGFARLELMQDHLIETRASEERGQEFRRTREGRRALGIPALARDRLPTQPAEADTVVELKIKTFDMRVMTGGKPVVVLLDELHAGGILSDERPCITCAHKKLPFEAIGQSPCDVYRDRPIGGARLACRGESWTAKAVQS